VSYNLLIETLQDSSVTDSQLFTQTIGVGDTHSVSITLSALGGTIEFTSTSPALSPDIDIPNSLELAGLAGTSTEVVFNVAETGGHQPVNNMTISTTDLVDQLGGTVLASEFSITPASFSLVAGSSQEVAIQINLDSLAPGVYQGSLILTSQNASPVMIPLTLEIQFHSVYLPVVAKNDVNGQ
jgi:hypothetical protein